MNSRRSETDNVLAKYIQTELLNGQSANGLSSEEDLLGSGLIDSIGIMKLIAFIEEKYSLKIPYEDMTIENFMTIGAISQYLDRRNGS